MSESHNVQIFRLCPEEKSNVIHSKSNCTEMSSGYVFIPTRQFWAIRFSLYFIKKILLKQTQYFYVLGFQHTLWVLGNFSIWRPLRDSDMFTRKWRAPCFMYTWAWVAVVTVYWVASHSCGLVSSHGTGNPLCVLSWAHQRHAKEWVVTHGLSHVTHVNESWHRQSTLRPVMGAPHKEMSHATRGMSHVICAMSHGTGNPLCVLSLTRQHHTREGVMSHVWMRHGTGNPLCVISRAHRRHYAAARSWCVDIRSFSRVCTKYIDGVLPIKDRRILYEVQIQVVYSHSTKTAPKKLC